MDWKEFFMPTKGKIIAFVILVFLFILIFKPVTMGQGIDMFMMLSMLINLPIILLSDKPFFINSAYIITPLGMIYNYLLVCVVSSIHKRLNKKNSQ